MNVTRLSRGLSLTLGIALLATQLLSQLVLLALFLSFLIFGAWFEMPVCWTIPAACSGYEKAAFFVLLFAASSLIADPVVDFVWRRTSAEDRHKMRRVGFSVVLALLLAVGAYAYLTSGSEGAASVLSLATSKGIVVLGFVLIAASVAAGLLFGAVGVLGGVSIIFARYLRDRLRRQDA